MHFQEWNRCAWVFLTYHRPLGLVLSFEADGIEISRNPLCCCCRQNYVVRRNPLAPQQMIFFGLPGTPSPRYERVDSPWSGSSGASQAAELQLLLNTKEEQEAMYLSNRLF